MFQSLLRINLNADMALTYKIAGLVDVTPLLPGI